MLGSADRFVRQAALTCDVSIPYYRSLVDDRVGFWAGRFVCLVFDVDFIIWWVWWEVVRVLLRFVGS